MWELTVLAVTRRAGDGCWEGMERYAGMIGGEWRLRLVRIPPSRGGPPARRVREESRALRAATPRGSRVVALDPGGDAMDSEGFCRMVLGWKDRGARASFWVGGAHGLDRTVLDSGDGLLCLSPMTLSHGLAGLVLLEQVYRAFARSTGRAYEK